VQRVPFAVRGGSPQLTTRTAVSSVTGNDVPSTGDEQERRRLVERLAKIDLGGGFV